VVDDFSRGRRESLPNVTLHVKDLADGVPEVGEVGAVIHAAARVGGVNYLAQDAWKNIKNGGIDWHVINHCVERSLPLVYLSSCCVYPCEYQTEAWHASHGGAYGLKEDDLRYDTGWVHPTEELYGLMKLAGEMAVQDAVRDRGLRGTIVRMFNVYGPREMPDPQTGHVIPALIGKVLSGQNPLQVWGLGNAMRSYLYVEDAAEGILDTLRYGTSGEVYNLGTEDRRTVNEIAQTILEACGVDVPIEHDLTKPTGAFGRLANIDKAYKELGWAPRVSLLEGVKRTVAWCKGVVDA
jgi:UDP-glucose 4-epimerase